MGLTNLLTASATKQACTTYTKFEKPAKRQYNAIQHQNPLDVFDQDQKHNIHGKFMLYSSIQGGQMTRVYYIFVW